MDFVVIEYMFASVGKTAFRGFIYDNSEHIELRAREKNRRL